MRIGIDARMYGPKATTGIGAYIKNLTDNLFLIDQVNEYVLFMKEPAFSKFNSPSARITKIKVNFPWYSISEQIKFPKLLLKHKLDLVHFPQFNVPIFYPKKFVVTIHDITPKFFPGPHVKKSLLRKLGYKIVFNKGIKKSEKIITISNYTKKNITKYFKVDEEKIKVTYLGFDNNFSITTDQQKFDNIKNKYNITKNFILYVGIWRDHKNLEGLISAFNILKSKHKLDYQLVLGGQQDDRYPKILQAIKNSPYKKDIITPGYIDDQELPLFYSAAKLFCLPSFSEGFGLVALEAMACGTVVAASDNTCLPEILDDTAAYFNPKDIEDIAKTINEVIVDQNLYQSLKNKGLNQISKYNWQACAQKTLTIYQSS